MLTAQPLDIVARLLLRFRQGESVPASMVSGATERRLRSLLDAGCLVRELRGRGAVWVCQHPGMLDAYIANEYPSGLYGAPGHTDGQAILGARTQALAERRDTKANGGLDFELVHVRVFNDLALTVDGASVDGVRQTQTLGCVSAVLGLAGTPQLAGRVGLVEGPEFFLRFDWQRLGVDVAVFYRGRASDRIIDWVDSPDVTSVVHCADFDPVGLDEYLRVQTRLREKVEPHQPADLELLFDRYAKVHSQTSLMPRLAQSSDPYVRRVLGLLMHFGRGLEHEAVLVDREQAI